MGLQDPALGVPDGDHRAWAAGIGAGSGDDVAFGIEAHPINASLGTPVILAKLMQHGIAAQGTVGQNVVGPELAEFRTGLDDVEGLLIRREQEAVGPGRIVRHAPARPGTVGLRIGAEDRVMVQHLARTGVDVDCVPGVAQPYPALTVDRQIVGGVEGHAIQAVHDGSRGAIGFKAHNGPSPGAATVQTAFCVEGQAIGVVGVFTEHGAGPGLRVIAQNAAGRDMGKQQRLAIPGGPLG